MGNGCSAGSGLDAKFRYVTDLRIPGFQSSVPPGSVGQYDFMLRDSITWYSNFMAEIEAAIGNRFLPIYRMADGEFIFSVGRYADLLGSRPEPRDVIRYALNKVRYWWKRKSQSELATCWGESYAEQELGSLRKHYIKCLKQIAKQGYMALHFTKTASKFSEQYLRPMSDWFDENDIPITPRNYLPFYFVYALLCGPDGRRLIENRNILVVTAACEDKMTKIAGSLIKLGAKSANFVSISPNKAMLDKIDLSKLSVKVDLALVGAGIGSANVLTQLESLQTLCIDAGVFVEVLSDPSKRNRVFTIPDNE